MCIELSELVIPCSNLFDVGVNLSLENIQLHIGSIILQALFLVAQVDGTLQTTRASGKNFRVRKR